MKSKKENTKKSHIYSISIFTAALVVFSAISNIIELPLHNNLYIINNLQNNLKSYNENVGIISNIQNPNITIHNENNNILINQNQFNSNQNLNISNSTNKNSNITNNTNIIYLFPTNANDVEVIGSYLSQSRYSMTEIYGNDISLYVSPFLWNIASNNGEVTLYINPYLYVLVNMTNIQKITPYIDVDGYPGLMYGQEYWFPFVGKTIESPELNLPMIVSDLPNFYSVLNYTVFNKTGIIDDFSYDIWLTQNPNTTYLKYGDFEVMIWMYWNNNLSENPYFIYVGNMTIPTLINNTIENLSWEVYILPNTGSANGWTGIYLLNPINNYQGEIGVPIPYILKNMGSYIQKAGINIYNPSEYYLNAIQVGMEFNDTNGDALLGYNLYSWYLIF